MLRPSRLLSAPSSEIAELVLLDHFATVDSKLVYFYTAVGHCFKTVSLVVLCYGRLVLGFSIVCILCLVGIINE